MTQEDIDSFCAVPKSHSFSRGFVGFFSDMPRKNVSLKIYLTCLIPLTVYFFGSKISTLSSSSLLKSIQKYNGSSIMTHSSQINQCLPHHKHSLLCTLSPIWNMLFPIVNIASVLEVVLFHFTREYTGFHPFPSNCLWIFDAQLQGSHNKGNTSSMKKNDS